jgi:hypothetical protein
MSSWEINRELKEIDKEREVFHQELSNKRKHMANMLLNDMGKDIDDVLNGRVKVELSRKEKIKYKIKYYINKLFDIL